MRMWNILSFWIVTTSLKKWNKQWLLYISTSVWVLHKPNAGQNSHAHRFFWKKALKKAKKFAAKFFKKQFFLTWHQNAGQVFYSQKIVSLFVWDSSVANFGKLLECRSLFENYSEISIYSRSKTMSNSGKWLDSIINRVGTSIISFYNYCFAFARLLWCHTYSFVFSFSLFYWRSFYCDQTNTLCRYNVGKWSTPIPYNNM